MIGKTNGVSIANATKDATMTANDMLYGVTGYGAAGTKITGTNQNNANTTDATATAADILGGETAYGSAGTKLTGTATDAIVVKTRNVSGYALTVDHYGGRVKVRQYYSYAPTVKSHFAYLTNVNFKDTLTVVEAEAFRCCEYLTWASLPDTVTTIGDSAFRQMAALALTSLPTSLTSIANSAFSECKKLATLDIPVGVTTVNIDVFSYCTSLTSINWPRGRVYNDASNSSWGMFSGCTSLANATLGSVGYPVTLVGLYVFKNCLQLGLTITLYVTPGAQPLANSPWGATNATIVYRSAVDGSVL